MASAPAFQPATARKGRPKRAGIARLVAMPAATAAVSRPRAWRRSCVAKARRCTSPCVPSSASVRSLDLQTLRRGPGLSDKARLWIAHVSAGEDRTCGTVGAARAPVEDAEEGLGVSSLDRAIVLADGNLVHGAHEASKGRTGALGRTPGEGRRGDDTPRLSTQHAHPRRGPRRMGTRAGTDVRTRTRVRREQEAATEVAITLPHGAERGPGNDIGGTAKEPSFGQTPRQVIE